MVNGCLHVSLHAGGGQSLRRRFQRLFDTSKQSHVDFDSRLDTGNLDGRRLAKKVRQGIEQPEDQGNQYRDVFPEGITVHGRVKGKD